LKGRALAVVIAAALVVGAFFLRRDVIEGDDAGTSDGGTSSEVVCATELADICAALVSSGADVTVTVEDAGATLDRLAALEDPGAAPLWLTIEPYPEMVDSIRGSARTEPLAFTTTPLGASQLGAALPSVEQLEVLTTACGTDPLWRCIGEHAGAPWSELDGDASWGTVRPALGDVDASALGLASFAHSVAGYFGDTEISRTRWETDPGFITWLRRLADVASGVSLSGGSALGTMATRPSALDVAATAGYELAAIDRTGERFAPNYPSPEMWLQAELAVPGGAAAPDDLAADLAEIVRESDWAAPSAATNPLPSAPTMLALRAQWDEAT
jgi:hypothetical protein